jgi:2-dehydro-3-deoxyphosphooctonate aldolase (KDO 8-P synthase)
LRALERVRAVSGLPLLTDIHEPGQAPAAAAVADVLQIPAFLCRQTDLLLAAGRTGRPVNVKKGQWLPPEGMSGSVEKVRSGGSREVAVTERGTFFGYGDLVVDMRNFSRLRDATGAPVIFDATHSVQQPGKGEAGTTGGRREFIPCLLAAAAVAGADGFFLETHPDPASALSDAATQWPLDRLPGLLDRTLDLWARAHGD